jgi:hypothetical protein
METKKTQTEQLTQDAVKCRFFSQYLYQDVLIIDNDHIWKVTGEVLDNIKDYEFITLKHISKITDEECIFIGTNILKIPIGLINYDHKVSYVKNVILNQLNKNISQIGNVNVIYSNFYLLDYLRKQGYAVPFMGYSVQELINFGWVLLS